MIQVSHESHIISPSFELDNTLQYFGAVAYLAKDFGNDNLFNQAKEQYQSLANKWYAQAKSEADRKSHKNWLGGGVAYTVISPMKFEAMIDFSLVTIFRQLPKENRIKALEFLLRVESPGFHTLSEAYQYAERATIIDRIKKEQIVTCDLDLEDVENKKKARAKEIRRKKEADKKAKLEVEQRELYKNENENIMNTPEYKLTYSILLEAYKCYDVKYSHKKSFLVMLVCQLLAYTFFMMVEQKILGWEILAWIAIFSLFFSILYPIYVEYMGNSSSNAKDFVRDYVSKRNNYDEYMVTYIFENLNYGRGGLSESCIIAYRKKNNLPINVNWHT